ncbi:MAG: NADH-quinone oxidoreductase subunit I [Firmicutes bacterium]|nr:NADH-quinone oxidoreductase subunit I [Bacillota bacterium]MCL5039019.1 NADH-quinone oxidoreductase subunit I [Bacillota bacterium]
MSSIIADILRSANSIVQGHLVTIREFFQKPVTEQYPDERLPRMEGYRGHPTLLVEPETGRPKCTACGACARACPNNAIELEGMKAEDGRRLPAKYRLDMTRCLVCNLCVEACPFDALAMSREYELVSWDREGLILDMPDLLRAGAKEQGLTYPLPVKAPVVEKEGEKA